MWYRYNIASAGPYGTGTIHASAEPCGMGTINPSADVGWPVWIGPLSSWVACVVWILNIYMLLWNNSTERCGCTRAAAASTAVTAAALHFLGDWGAARCFLSCWKVLIPMKIQQKSWYEGSREQTIILRSHVLYSVQCDWTTGWMASLIGLTNQTKPNPPSLPRGA
jgi:hypothetical protein